MGSPCLAAGQPRFLKPASHVRFVFAVELLLIHSDTGGFAESAPNIKRIA